MSNFDQLTQVPTRSTLFVGDLSYFCTEEHLKRVFAPYGPAINGVPSVSAEIKRGKYGDSLMHGFVYLSSVEAAELAIEDLNNKKFMGRYMRVSWASPHIANCEPRPRENWSQVHVTFSTPFLDLFVTEEFLEDVFSAFGSVADVTIKRHNRNTTVPPSHSGYAFVYYYELPPAARAVQRFSEMTEVNNVRLMCNLPHVIRDKHEKPFYARNEPRGNMNMSRGNNIPRPQLLNNHHHHHHGAAAGKGLGASQFNSYPPSVNHYNNNNNMSDAYYAGNNNHARQNTPHHQYDPRDLLLSDPLDGGYAASNAASAYPLSDLLYERKLGSSSSAYQNSHSSNSMNVNAHHHHHHHQNHHSLSSMGGHMMGGAAGGRGFPANNHRYNLGAAAAADQDYASHSRPQEFAHELFFNQNTAHSNNNAANIAHAMTSGDRLSPGNTNTWPSPASTPLSGTRKELMTALTSHNSGDLSLTSWQSMSHSNSLNFGAGGANTPIGQTQKMDSFYLPSSSSSSNTTANSNNIGVSIAADRVKLLPSEDGSEAALLSAPFSVLHLSASLDG